jgi:hypothetical protein
VTFTAYPYKIANTPKVYVIALAASGEHSESILNESGHPVSLTIENTVSITLGLGTGAMASIYAGSGTYSALKIAPGLNTIRIFNSEAKPGTVQVSFREEVI